MSAFRRRLPLAASMAVRTVPDALELNTLTLLITFRCNYECDHCVFRSGPLRQDRMSEPFARGVITAAKAAAPRLEMVSFSGGEPFLERRLLHALHEHASALGLQSAVVTNAYWARTEEVARDVLAPLHALGLVDLTTSLDTFHLAYGPPARVRHAVVAAQRLGLRTHLNIAVRAGSSLRADNAHTVLGLTRADLAHVTLCEFAPTRVGWADDRLPLADIPAGDDPRVFGGSCTYVLRTITVTPDGSAYACCGVGGASDDGPARLLRLGSLHERTFEDLQTEMQQSLLCRLIARVGPYALIELARSANPDLQARRRFSHICDVCHELTTNESLRSAVTRILDGIGGRMPA